MDKKVFTIDGPDKFLEYFYREYGNLNGYHYYTKYCRDKANKRYKKYLKRMKKLYKVGGWTCLLIGLGCLWGIGAVAVFLGLTLFWFGANIDDAKCY